MNISLRLMLVNQSDARHCVPAVIFPRPIGPERRTLKVMRNRWECLLALVIDKAVNEHLLFRPPRPSLALQNHVLSFYVENAALLTDVSEPALLRLLDLAQTHPTDWRQRAAAGFRVHPRAMKIPRKIPCISKHIRLDPRLAFRDRIVYRMFEEEVHLLADESVDLVFTSPPYAMQRADQYGGIEEHEYPRWTSRWMELVRRVLKPRGSVALVIRPHVSAGRTSSYVRRTLDILEQDGWIYCEEWPWVKSDAPPLGHPGRPRRAWESVHWLSLVRQPYCNAYADGSGDARLGFEGSVRNPHARSVTPAAEVRRGLGRATDVIIAGVSSCDRSIYNTHPAQFPTLFAEKVIRRLAPAGGLVLDPFIGSGTTAVAAIRNGRHYVGFEKDGGSVNTARLRIKEAREEAAAARGSASGGSAQPIVTCLAHSDQIAHVQP